jgi:hypothetical protein
VAGPPRRLAAARIDFHARPATHPAWSCQNRLQRLSDALAAKSKEVPQNLRFEGVDRFLRARKFYRNLALRLLPPPRHPGRPDGKAVGRRWAAARPDVGLCR